MPDPAVVTTMRRFKRDLLRGERTHLQEMARRWLRVEARLMGQMDALALQMANVARDGGTVSQGMLWSEVRYQELLAQLRLELDRYTGYAERTIAARQGQLARLGIAHSSNAITVQGITAGFNRLPIEAVEYMVGNSGNSGNGAPLRGLLVASWPDAAEGLTQALVDGIALGHNPRKVARDMARGSTRSLDRMMLISRTETMRVYRHASLENYRRSGVVTGYKRLCAHDRRVCPACLADEGTLYDLADEMPEHPQGRCVAVPVVEGVPNVTWQAGADWFVEQDAATQQSILGKGRYAAWLAGAFDLRDMVRVVNSGVWGPSLESVPLQELVAT